MGRICDLLLSFGLLVCGMSTGVLTYRIMAVYIPPGPQQFHAVIGFLYIFLFFVAGIGCITSVCAFFQALHITCERFDASFRYVSVISIMLFAILTSIFNYYVPPNYYGYYGTRCFVAPILSLISFIFSMSNATRIIGL